MLFSYILQIINESAFFVWWMGFDEIKKLIDSKQMNNLNRWPVIIITEATCCNNWDRKDILKYVKYAKYSSFTFLGKNLWTFKIMNSMF